MLSTGTPQTRQPTRLRRVRPVFVVTTARSGSTLLRYLLDAHPEVTSPPELNLSAMLQHLVEIWSRTSTALDLPDAIGHPAPGQAIPAGIRKRARRPVDELMLVAANAAGASLYCDKSLTTVDHLATIGQCYPEASLVFLYRYPLDMIASGLEASKWGFNAFGFTPFVAANPGNFVGALANYWIDRVSKMVAFERSCSLAHARIYYELLCDDPLTTLSELFDFLGLKADAQVIERAFESEHGTGPGDYKIDYNRAIKPDSIGRGATLPDALAPQQVARIDELLAELDYPKLAAGRRGNLAALLGLKAAAGVRHDTRAIADEVARLLGDANGREAINGHARALPLELAIWAPGADAMLVTVDERGASRAGLSAESPRSIPRVRCTGDVLLRVASGELPFAEAVHDQLIRVEPAGAAPEREPEAPRRILAALAALIPTAGCPTSTCGSSCATTR